MKVLALLIEIIGIITCSAGIGIEVYTREPIYHVMIVGGSVVFATGSLLYAKVVRKERKDG